MEQEVKRAARRAIAQMARMAADQEPDTSVCYQSKLAQLALAQVALAYPHASVGTCVEDGAPLHFVAGEDGLYIRCSSEGSAHGWKVA